MSSANGADAEALFRFATIKLGDFESCLLFIDTLIDMNLKSAAAILWWQTCRTFERLVRRDYDDAHHQIVQDFANQCVQQYTLLSYGADCGAKNLRKYLHEYEYI